MHYKWLLLLLLLFNGVNYGVRADLIQILDHQLLAGW